MTLDDLVHAITRIAEEAGAAAMRHYRTGVAVASKADRSPVTAADRDAHEHICSALATILPGVTILSEEQDEHPEPPDEFWLVDPLDGTREFISGSGEFTVNIALVRNGIAVAGVVHAPAAGVTYSAARGGQAMRTNRGGAPAPIVPRVPAAHPVRVAVSRDHSGPAETALLRDLGAVAVPMGSSLKFCAVAEGSADLYPRFGTTMEWDTAAAQCVVETAGGSVVSTDGTPLRYGKRDLRNPSFFVFADRELSKRVLSLI